MFPVEPPRPIHLRKKINLGLAPYGIRYTIGGVGSHYLNTQAENPPPSHSERPQAEDAACAKRSLEPVRLWTPSPPVAYSQSVAKAIEAYEANRRGTA